MGCVLNGVDAVHAAWMDEALIFGAGLMGLLMGMALKAEGVANVAFVDIAESRLELASSFGFGAVPAGSDALESGTTVLIWRLRPQVCLQWHPA